MQEQNKPQDEIKQAQKEQETDGRNERQKQKSRAKKVVVALVVIALVSVLGNWLLDSMSGEEQKGNSLYIDPNEFWPVNDSEDIFQNSYYMGLDRRIHYYEPSTGAEYSLEENQLASAEGYLKFFYQYFQCVIRGDEQGYISFFSDAYLEANEDELPESFTMQMVYDIVIKPYETGEEEADDRDGYLVNYKIYRNNGTFRDDIVSDASRELLIYLVREPSPIDAELTGGLVIDEIIHR